MGVMEEQIRSAIRSILGEVDERPLYGGVRINPYSDVIQKADMARNLLKRSKADIGRSDPNILRRLTVLIAELDEIENDCRSADARSHLTHIAGRGRR